MSEHPGITCIVAAYNLGDSLVRCVHSIQEQTLDQLEILIVNDRSTDDTLDIATNLCLSDPKLRTRCISHTSNLGLSAVRNTGLLAAQMKYIWHIDGDDFLPGNNVALQLFQSLEELGLVILKFPVIELIGDREFDFNWYASKKSPNYSCESVSPFFIAKKYGFRSAFSLIYSKRFALELKIFSLEGVSIGEDQILNAQLLKGWFSVGHVNIPMYVYDKTSTSMMRSSWNFEKYLEDRLYINFIRRLNRYEPHLLASIVAQERSNYLFNELSKRAHKDLATHEEQLLKLCWLSDLKLLNPSGNVNNSIEPVVQAYLDKLSTDSRKLNLCEMFDFVFSDTSFVIHVGAHKTATTYMQACLHSNRYELARQGIIYIDYMQFRHKILNRLIDENLDDLSIRSALVELVLPLLFCKPKKIIIFDENLVADGKNFWDNKSLSYAFAFYKDGFSLGYLRRLVIALKGKSITLVYCIRDIQSYMQSFYLEKIKWAYFEDFESYINHLMVDLKSISWEFICKELRDLCASQNLKDPIIASFEQIQGDISSFLNFLIQTPHDLNYRDFVDFKFPLLESVLRASPSKEAITLAFQSLSHMNRISAQRLYKKLVLSGYGSSKFEPLSEDKFSDFASFLSDLYERNKDSLVTYQPLDAKYSDAGSITNSASTFESLSGSVSPHENRMSFLSENISDDLDPANSNVLWTTLSCFERYTNLEDNSNFEFERSHHGFIKEKGISAMLRVKNEEYNIKRVLLDCLKVFDEIIVIDNNSSDKTLSIVADVQLDTPKAAGKIKVYSYPFDVARCGLDNYLCSEDSVHSLAYFYNFCLSKCQFSHVFKWDGDMFLPTDMVTKFQDFKIKVLKSSSLFSTYKSTVFGRAIGLTVYKGHNGKFYLKSGDTQGEVRLFENRSDVRFVKDILWEKLFFPFLTKDISSVQPVFVELKDVSKNEFSHWKPGVLGMGVREKKELNNYILISQLTSQGKEPTGDELARHGFEEYLNFPN